MFKFIFKNVYDILMNLELVFIKIEKKKLLFLCITIHGRSFFDDLDILEDNV